MSESPPNPSGVEGASSVGARVLDVVAETTGLSRAEILTPTSPLHGLLDSLTSIAIVTRLETIFGIALSDEALALLAARDLGGLGRLIERKLAAQHTNLDETTGNRSC